MELFARVRQPAVNKTIRLWVIASIIAILLLGVILWKEKSVKNQTIRISFPYEKKEFDLDPSRIGFAYEGIILDNMYGRLVRYNDSNELEADLADDFFWNDNHFQFVFSGNRKTSLGEPITAEDAEYSLKRLLILKGNTHGKLSDYLCQDQELKSIGDSCAGIRVEGKNLKLYPKSTIDREVFLSVLSGIDFSIIPRAAIDRRNLSRIADYSNTTGAYYLDTSKSGSLEFRKNNFSNLIKPQSINSWTLHRGSIVESTEGLGSKFDLITTASFIKESKQEKLERVSYFETAPLSIETLVFTEQSQISLSVSERAFIIDKMKSILLGLVDPDNSSTFQLFPPDAFGRIAEVDEENYRILLNKKTKPSRIVKIGFPGSVYDKVTRFVEKLKLENIVLVESDPLTLEKNPEKIDAMYIVTDSAFQEDVSLFSYNFSFFFYGIPREVGEKWLEKYISSSRLNRVRFVEELHNRVLLNMLVAPLYYSSYRVAGIDDLDLSGLDPSTASTHIWKIKLR